MLNKIKAGISKVVEQKGITISITADILNNLINRYPIDSITNSKVEIEDGIVQLSGTTKIKKFGLEKEIDFTLFLRPINVEKRNLQLELVNMKPINIDQINKKVLQRPPILTYEKSIISIDLNGIEAVRKIPVGNVQQLDVEDNKIIVGIGI
ncbi:hypothetical protein SAMN05880501_105186 [Ureibacillus xyleni]|uniref:DUF2993 domain-containing protein n=1 Tax=Ureibacillus xyleni TaxID=614648 RepID=A0A285SSK5_9BACL|nr:hypothetical protein [Ureibacillus xyleni]SOC09147.1 hypothetical protein SAMN05880501_105186 [Ureibacillus xyleni]